MIEHRWTDGKGVEHIAYRCAECGQWFDSPSLHVAVEAPSEMVEQVKRLSAALPDDLSEASVEAVEDVLRATYDALTVEAPCTTCGGTRKVRKPSELGPGMHVNTVSWVPCPDCSTCPTCGSHDRQFVFEACDPENGGVTQDPWHTQGGVS